jgi:predicted N-formylglutamate amidohydrolase
LRNRRLFLGTRRRACHKHRVPTLPDAARLQPGADPRLLLVCDHASKHVPPGIDLGLPDAALGEHIAYDIGAAALTEAVASRLDAPAWLATVSRLVVDMNRPPEQSVSTSSDGIAIPGNQRLSAQALRQRHALHHAFHTGLAALIAANRPQLLVSVHSFTPALATDPRLRPWPIALLWNQDDRAARLGLAALAAEPGLGGPIGANRPYSGRELNYTMDRHAEANAIPYLGFEIRQDLIADDAGVARWAGVVARTIRTVSGGL